MKKSGRWVFEQAPQRWWISLPFLVALVVLLFLGWVGWTVLSYPEDGISALDYQSGEVLAVDPHSPNHALIFPGDILRSVNGNPVAQSPVFYVGKTAGDLAIIQLVRDGAPVQVVLPLWPPSLSAIIIRLMPLLAALLFWTAGVIVQAFMPSENHLDIFFWWTQVGAVALAAGTASYLSPAFVSSIFNVTVWLIGPVSVHLHLQFPQDRRGPGPGRMTLVLYALAGLGTLPTLLLRSNQQQTLPLIINLSRLFLAANLLLVVAVLFYSYRTATSPGVRGKIRIVALGGGLSALVLVALTILPDVLFQAPFLPYPFAFLLLAILPITYAYAIFRHRLVEIEKHISRGATLIMVYTILGGFYLVLYAVLHNFLPPDINDAPLINTLLVLVLASIFFPLHGHVQRVIDTVFYGGWYDYRTAMVEITQGLEQITSLPQLARAVGERLVRMLHLEDVCIFLRDESGEFSVVELTPQTGLRERQAPVALLPRSSLSYLLNVGAIERSSLRKTLAEVDISAQELQLLNSEQVNLWVPVIGHGQVLGLMALGPKFGGDVYSGEDMDILRVVARQLSPVIENVHLLTRLRQHAADLEQRVQARTTELFNEKERVEAILASVGDGVIVSGLDGRIQTVNKAFEHQAGYLADELEGSSLEGLFDFKGESRVLDDMRIALQQGHAWQGELVGLRKSGEPYNVQLNIAPVHDQNGQLVRFVSSQRDITRQKELDHLKDNFIADVSHELRTPTTNICLYLELLDSAHPEKRDGYLKVVKEQSVLLSRLVEDILDLSRLARGKVNPVEFKLVDLNRLARETANAHLPLASGSRLRLETELADNLPQVRGDPHQLSRAVANLVSNAIRYTENGRVLVRTYSQNGDACLEVHDSGIGIDPEDLPHVFERFYRGRNVRQSKTHGTGLGLAIVREILDLHHAEVQVRSVPNQGTVFTIRIPVARG